MRITRNIALTSLSVRSENDQNPLLHYWLYLLIVNYFAPQLALILEKRIFTNENWEETHAIHQLFERVV
jgi:hypothetical protein